MFQLLVVPAAALLVVGNPVPGGGKDRAVALAEAVKEFNQRARGDATGKAQPPLTEDEVVAIRGWIRDRVPATDEVYQAYQTIADTRMLPRGARLSYLTRWTVGFNGHEFDVWWVDLHIQTGPRTGYTFRIRDRKLRCRLAKRDK